MPLSDTECHPTDYGLQRHESHVSSEFFGCQLLSMRFFLILAGEKNMRPKIELDIWKDKEFGSSDDDFLGIWGLVKWSEIHPGTTCTILCVNETVA